METLSSIRKQIVVLEKKAQELIKKESAQVIAKVRELIEKHGLTAEDVGLTKRGKDAALKAARGRAKRGSKKVGKSVGVPMYRDPETGKTWTGRGKPPTWIAGAADRSRFLINQPAAETESSSEKKPRTPKKTAAASKKTSAKRTSKPGTPAKEAVAQAGKASASAGARRKAKGRGGVTLGRAGVARKVGGASEAAARAGEQSA